MSCNVLVLATGRYALRAGMDSSVPAGRVIASPAQVSRRTGVHYMLMSESVYDVRIEVCNTSLGNILGHNMC